MPPPDLILHSGKIITLDHSSRIAQAISVRAGRVVDVGDDAALLKEAAPTTERIDLAGCSVLPGFFDAHPHADREGLKARGGIPIAGLRSVADIVDVVKRAAQTTPAGEWIVLMPMGEPPHEYISRPEQLTDGRFPTRHDLDAVAPDHPVYIRAVWGWWSRRPFPSVANSLALARAGVTRDTPAPHNVEIVTDARGEPTGVFLEGNFVPVLEYTLFRGLPRFKYSDRLDSVRLGAQAYVAVGTTFARWDDDGQRRLGDSRLSREEALRMASQSGHRLTWNDEKYGSLQAGKVADMVVLAEDPLSCDLDRLKDIRVDRTFLGGRQVFGPS
jgi:predicted amidohydrolase YtcJ